MSAAPELSRAYDTQQTKLSQGNSAGRGRCASVKTEMMETEFLQPL
uniref:Uncharacterized protein n=1 Tax=Pelodiscus sinensis TaxID=13735 RepID=K7F7H3_PELSI